MVECSAVHQYQDLITIFNGCFFKPYNTQLVRGGDEPLYVPAHENQPYNALMFAHGYYSSALHESAHWLIAGDARRKLVDFGYWYEPDGRTAEQQTLFQRVEVKPQALEWILSVAANYRFRVSIDNLHGAESDTIAFKKAIYQQVIHYCEHGIPPRATLLRNALCRFYGTSNTLTRHDFNSDSL